MARSTKAVATRGAAYTNVLSNHDAQQIRADQRATLEAVLRWVKSFGASSPNSSRA